MASMQSTVYVDDIREIKEENPFESMMSRFDRAAQLLNLDAGFVRGDARPEPGAQSLHSNQNGFGADPGF